MVVSQEQTFVQICHTHSRHVDRHRRKQTPFLYIHKINTRDESHIRISPQTSRTTPVRHATTTPTPTTKTHQGKNRKDISHLAKTESERHLLATIKTHEGAVAGNFPAYNGGQLANGCCLKPWWLGTTDHHRRHRKLHVIAKCSFHVASW